MKLALPLAALAAVFANASAENADIKVDSKVYVGDDFGLGCEKLGVDRMVQKTGVPLVYCFTVTNTGDAPLDNVVLTSSELNNFVDNSVGKLAPGATKMVTYQSKIDGDLVSNIVVSADTSDVTNKSRKLTVTAADSTQVIDVETRRKRRNLQDKASFKAPTDLESCIGKQWTEFGNPTDLVCAEKDVFIESLISEETGSCITGETITVTLDATIYAKAGENFFDLGWYMDTSGGDAMSGDTCVINGLQDGNTYDIQDPVDPVSGAGEVVWGSGTAVDFANAGFGFSNSGGSGGFGNFGGTFGSGGGGGLDSGGLGSGGLGGVGDQDSGVTGDGDECGDVIITSESGGSMSFPIAVQTTLACTDENGDGMLDFALCFTWRSDENNDDSCLFATNLPGADTGSCYCSRYDVPNIAVTLPDVDPTVPC